MSSPPAALAGRWQALWAICLARLAMGYQFQVIGASAPVLHAEYGLDLAQIGWLVGLFSLAGAAVSLPGGLLGARWGDRRVAALGLALMAIGGIAMAVADDYTGLQLGRLLSGAGAVIFNVTATKMVSDWFAGGEILLAMSLFVSTWPVGVGMGLLTLGLLAEQMSSAAAFGATAAVAAVGAVVLLAAYRAPPVIAAVQAIRLSALSRHEWTIALVGGTGWGLYNVAFALMVGFLPTVFAAQGFSVASAGAVTGIACGALVASIWVGGWLVSRSGRPMLVALLGLAFWSVTMVATVRAGMPLLWLLVGGFAAGMPTGMIASVPGRAMRPGARGAGTGVFYTVYYALMAVLPGIAGDLAMRMGDAAWTIWAAVGCVAATALIMLTVERWIAAGRRDTEAAGPVR